MVVGCFRLFLALSFSIIAALSILGADNTVDLRNCDLLFQTDGQGAFSDAITGSTARDTAISVVHVAIVLVDDDAINVIEADPEAGVRIASLNDFLESSPKIDGHPGVVAMRLDIPFNQEETRRRALSHVGEDYDWWFMPKNGKMYCSELVSESFRDLQGSEVFKLLPMSFRQSDGTMPRFWIDLYAKLGVDVPEGCPGTNPNDMFRDPRLIEVGRYF